MQQDYGPSYIPPEERFKNSIAELEQITTRGDGALEFGEEFRVEDINFGSSLEHLKIHQGGDVAGSQFNGELIKDSDDLKFLLKKLLPPTLHYDQFGRAELTLNVDSIEPVGYSGVKSLEEIRETFPDTKIEQRVRIPGGTEDIVDGMEGAWYPETVRTNNGLEVAKTPEGEIKNQKAKFEPKANIVRIPKDKFQTVAKTNKFTAIIQKIDNKPTVLTIFPGENAPAYPARINTESYKADSTGDSKETKFWNDHAFIELM
jgi:hypothetical protein